MFNIENKKTDETAVTFTFDGAKMAVDNGVFKKTEISREELESLVDWLRCGLEKMNRDAWENNRVKACDCVRPA
jgi:hypothetical protein